MQAGETLDRLSKDLPPEYSNRLARSRKHPELLVDDVIGIQGDIMEDLGRPWPACPLHARHPLSATETGWVCPKDRRRRWEYGAVNELPEAHRPEMADGEIVFTFDGGWGVIAHNDGDIWFHASSVHGAAFEELEEGTVVEYDLVSTEPTQGRFRCAETVRAGRAAGLPHRKR